jgi:hypothetical protein
MFYIYAPAVRMFVVAFDTETGEPLFRYSPKYWDSKEVVDNAMKNAAPQCLFKLVLGIVL